MTDAGPRRRAVTLRRIERSLLGATAATVLASALACVVGAHVLWNWTPSLPLGLYWVSPGTLRT